MPKKGFNKLGLLAALLLCSSLAAAQLPFQAGTALAADPVQANPVWPETVTSIGMGPSLNIVWGKALSSDINWTFDTGGDTPFTNVIVVNGLAYVGSMMNYVYALDAVTGKLAWKFLADNWIMTNPVVADGKLFIGSGNRFYQTAPSKGGLRGTGPNSLYALDAKTGRMLWQYSVPGEAMPTPLYKDGIVYYVTGDRNLYALDAATGKLVYKYYLGSIFSMGSINLDGDIMVFGGGFPFKVFGFNLKTRTVAWETPFPDVYLGLDDSNPAVANGLLYINGVAYDTTAAGPVNPRHEFYALDTQTGQLRWKFTAGLYSLVDDNKSSTPVVVDGVYYGASSIARSFSALDAATGAVKWQYGIGQVVKGAPVVFSNFVIFADAKGNIYTLNRNTGKLIKKVSLGGNIGPQGPSLFNGTLYLANQNGEVLAFSVTKLINESLRAPEPVPPANSNTAYFSPTGHAVSGAFLDYWQKNGGLAQFGYPITGEISEFHASEGKTYQVQYFERARFEMHDQVVLGRVGSEITANRLSEKAFQPAAAPAVPAPASTSIYFSPTGHAVSGAFLDYWQKNGGLARFGYPISEPHEETLTGGQTLTIQYFERARFELHSSPAETGTNSASSPLVMLGLVGLEKLSAADFK
jgi:outer membrane protein assembly factor BamB